MPQGSLALYRRHLSSCPHVAKGNHWTRCHCPIWVQGSIGGEPIRRSLNTTNWTAASSVVHQWQAAGQIGVLKPEIPTVAEAVAKFLDEAAVRNLAATTIQKRRELLVGKLLPFCERRGFHRLRELTVEALRAFRQTWTYSPLSAVKRLEYLRAFLRFCYEAAWIDANPALALRPTKVSQKQTLPFTDEEVDRLLVAARGLVRFRSYGPRMEPMILLLRYSGLRIQDAACLERSRLTDDKLFLYTQKTGTPVYCPMPTSVVERLACRAKYERPVFLLRREESAGEHGQELGSRVSEDRRVGRSDRRGLSSASLPRHLRGLPAPQGRLAGERVEAARPQLDQDHRTALCPMGEGPAGAAGGGGAADLEPDRRGDGLARVTRPCAASIMSA